MGKNRVQRALMHSNNRSQLLSNSTDAEKAACSILRKLGISYVRQFPIYTGVSTFYADIYIPKYKLVLEIDGGYHFTQTQKRKDGNRSAAIRRLGYHVYRLTNKNARNVDKVLAKIRQIHHALNHK